MAQMMLFLWHVVLYDCHYTKRHGAPVLHSHGMTDADKPDSQAWTPDDVLYMKQALQQVKACTPP